MTYREETEGLKTRLAEVEGELADAREKIARLEGVTAAPSAADAGAIDWMTGGPAALHIERELPFEVTDEGYEAIAELLRRRLPGQNPRFPGMGQVSQVGRTLTYINPAVQARVSRADGRTKLQIDANHKTMRLGVILGSFYGSVFMGVLVTAILKARAITPFPLLVALPIVLVLTVMTARRIARTAVASRRASLSGVFEAMVELAEAHAKKKPGSRIEVAGDREAEAEADAAEEAEAADGEASAGSAV